jgi:hypothetical protein
MDSDEVLFSFGEISWQTLPGDLHAVLLQAIKREMPGANVRLHRNIPEIFWCGTVHEQLTWCGNEPIISPRVLPGISLVHSGYENPSIVRVKNNRNAAIARRRINLMSRGELTALARSETENGRFNVMLWIRLLFHPGRPRSAYSDPRHEPALMLLSSGYAAPAADVLRANPLNVPLHLAVLADEWRSTGKINEARVDHITGMLERGLFDPLYVFPVELLRSNRDSIIAYARGIACEWMERRKTMPEANTALVDPETVYQRCANFEAETFEDDLILMHGVTWQALALNGRAAALWEALAWPQTPQQLATLLKEALPDRPAPELLKQVNAVLSELLSHAFIEPHPVRHREQ